MRRGARCLIVSESLEPRRLLAYSPITDINTKPVSVTGPPYAPSEALGLNGVAIFAHIDVSQNIELWRTDGTAGGTVMVEDLNPGFQPSFPQGLVRAGDVGYFTASVGGSIELFRSDGSDAGTYPLKDTNPGGADGVFGVTPIGSRLFFFARHPTLGTELWVSDGTEATTTLVKDITAGSGSTVPDRIGTDGTRLFFEFGLGHTLWVSDGSEAGTTFVKNVDVISPIVGSGGFAYFGDSSGNLRRSDGTDAGTIVAGANVGKILELADVNGTLFFTTTSLSGTVATKLWRYSPLDGLQQVTQPGGTSVALPTSLTPVGSTLYFVNSPASTGMELWRVDADSTAASIVQDLAAGSASSQPRELTNVNGTLYFAAYVGGFGLPQLLKVTGPTSGATWLAELRGDSGILPGGFSAFGSELLFYNYDAAAGWELWKSDSTIAGTGIITNANPATADAGPVRITPLGNRYLFAADDGVHGRELWISDGTAGGTVMVKDINPGSAAGSPWRFTPHGSRIFFTAADAAGQELWVTDGTTAGTYRVKDVNPGAAASNPGQLVVSGDLVFFTANDGTHGPELWRSDGTDAGTFRLGEIRPGTAEPSFILGSMEDGTVVLSADDGVHGRELWRSDGTPQGTYLLLDINSDPAAPFGSSPGHFRVVGGVMYFTAIDEVSGRELWKTDGTAGGTVLVADIAPGEAWSTPAYGSNYDPTFIEYRGRLYFEATGNATQGAELWRTDGTQAGTMLVKDLLPGDFASSSPRSFRVIDDKLYFIANSDTSFFNPVPKLWVSDGTTEGTVQVPIDHIASQMSFLHVANGQMFFAAPVPPRSYHETFTTDGTVAGTQRVTTITDERLNAHPGSQVYPLPDGSFIFTLDDDVYGSELWRLEDVWAPRVGSGRLENESGDAIVLRASERLGAIDPTRFAIMNVATGLPVDPASVAAQFIAGSDEIRFTFPGQPGGRLPDGHYRATLAAGGLSDVAGNASAGSFQFEFFTAGQSGADSQHYRLHRSGDNVLIYKGAGAAEPAAVLQSVPVSGLNAIAFHGGGGDDLVTLDLSGGEVLPVGGLLVFDGGDGSDSLILRAAAESDRFFADASSAWRDGRRLEHHHLEQMTVAAGTVHLRGDVGGLRLHLAGSDAAAVFHSDQHLADLLVTAGARASVVAHGGRTIVARDLEIDAGSQLDLADNTMILDYTGASPLGSWTGSAYTGVLGLIASGYNYTAWNGDGIVTSMPAASTGLTTLGVSEVAKLLGVGPGDTAVWAGHTVDATTVIVKYTYAGDANLDGMIDAGDYGIIDNFVQIAGASGYGNGDFNYDGFIDAGDYGIIDNNIQAQGVPQQALSLSATAEEPSAQPVAQRRAGHGQGGVSRAAGFARVKPPIVIAATPAASADEDEGSPLDVTTLGHVQT